MKLTKRRLSIGVAIVMASALAWLNLHYKSAVLAQRLDTSARQRLSQTFAQLPLRFEANAGQYAAPIRFAARGIGYALSLTSEEAVLQLRDTTPQRAQPAMLRMQWLNANRAAPLTGWDEQAGRTNYLIGARPLTGIKSFGKVQYENVWRGIDLVFYGNQRQLEYDFRLAPGADPKQIRLAFTGADKLQLDAQGALTINIGGAQVRWLKPVAFQEVNGARCEIACDYRIKNGNQIVFALGAYDRTRPLVIDPALVYSTWLGGLFDDYAYGLAIDGAGHAYVTGSTTSPDFTTSNPLQPALASRNRSDAFILKIAPHGGSLLYSTYLGGGGSDAAYAIAVDEAGNAYVAGETDSADFPQTAGRLQPRNGGFADAFVAKLNAAGAQLVYATFLGGNYDDRAYGLAIDAGGNAYVTGYTDSTDFPVSSSIRSNSTPLFKTTDSAANWSARHNGLPNAQVQALAFSPPGASVIFAATSLGLFRSADGGAQWSFNGPLPTVSGSQPLINAVRFDPKMPAIAYLATSQGVYKSFNGAASFQLRSIGLPAGGNIFTVLVDPVTPATLYAGTPLGVYKSTNGGESWLSANNVSGDNLGSTAIRSLVFDPTNPATIYAGTARGVYKTTNSAGVWTAINTGLGTGAAIPAVTALAIDPSAPLTLYAAGNTANAVLFKTTNGGASWQPSDNGLSATMGGVVTRMAAIALAIDPTAPALVYAGTPLGVFKTTDGGGNWSLASAGLTTRNVTALAIDPMAASTLYAGAAAGSDAFVAKLNASGSALAYALYLGGDQADSGRGIAVDVAGNAWVTGRTNSPDFPTARALQTRLNGMGDAFVVKLDAAGNAPTFATFLGGSGADAGYAVALDAAGNAYVGGATSSNNFPTANAFKSAYGGGANDGFVTKYKADGSAIEYATYLGGQGDDQIFALTVDRSGSVWVTGETGSPDFPVINSLKQFAFRDAFVTRFNAEGKGLLFSTYLGGNFGLSTGRAIAVDALANAYIAGVTSDFSFPQINAIRASNALPNGFAVKLGPAPDLAVTLAAQPEPVLSGAELAYTATITNVGELSVTGVKLLDQLPSGATLVSATASQGSCTGTNDITCALGELAAGAMARVIIIINAPPTGTTSNTVTVSANEAESKTDNNTATATSQIQTADLALTKTVTHLQLAPGGRLSWIITVSNTSRVKTGSITINDVLPAATTFVACTTTAGSCAGTGNERAVTMPSLDAEATATVIFTATVNNDVAPGTTFTNTATLAPLSFDPNANNNQASATTMVVAPAPAEVGNGLIAFGNTGINIIRPDGTGRFTLVTGNNPVWSPDGMKLAYEPAQFQNSAIINADGSGNRTLTQSGYAPAWSPDGTRLAFYRFNTGIVIINADGANERVILTRLSNHNGTGIRWSPDGTRLAITAGALYVVNIDGSDLRQLTTTTPLARDGAPAWSPDGTKLLFAGGENVVSGRLYLINADGSGLQPLGSDNNVAYPTWSPDGTKIAYASGNVQLFVSNADGSAPVRIVNDNANSLIRGIDWQRATALQSPSLVVSGRLRGPNGAGISGQVELTGARSATATADSAGFYAFGNLPAGGDYTVRPVATRSRFDPPSRTYYNLTTDQTDADFTLLNLTINIRGRITDTTGAPLGGVTVILGPAGLSQTETDADGNFVFTDLSPAGRYSVEPVSRQNADLFDPPFIIFPAGAGERIANFRGARESFAIAGLVLDRDSVPVSDVVIALNGGGRNTSAVTDAQGRYRFNDLPSGHVYTLRAVKTGVSFTPATRRVLLNKNQDVWFFAGLNSVTVVSAASFNPQAVTVGGIVALFGEGLAATTGAATGSGLPTILENVFVQFSNRNTPPRGCQLFFVSPRQINAVIPTPNFPLDATSIAGEALLEVFLNTRRIAAAEVRIERVAPALFAADGSGRGLAAAVALRVRADNTQVFEPLYRFDAPTRQFVPIPLDLSNAAEQVFLVLFGTGIRYRTDPASPRVQLGGAEAMVTFAGPQPNLVALDQVNVLIPRTLAGRGDVDVVLTADGKAANTVRINIK